MQFCSDVFLLKCNCHFQQTDGSSTFTVTRSLTKIFMLLNNWTMNRASLTAYDNATHSASELNSIMLFCTFDHQNTGIPKIYTIKWLSLILLMGSPALSLLLNHTLSQGLLVSPDGSNFKLRFDVLSTYLITHSNSWNTAEVVLKLH